MLTRLMQASHNSLLFDLACTMTDVDASGASTTQLLSSQFDLVRTMSCLFTVSTRSSSSGYFSFLSHLLLGCMTHMLLGWSMIMYNEGVWEGLVITYSCGDLRGYSDGLVIIMYVLMHCFDSQFTTYSPSKLWSHSFFISYFVPSFASVPVLACWSWWLRLGVAGGSWRSQCWSSALGDPEQDEMVSSVQENEEAWLTGRRSWSGRGTA